jgi:3-(3-hydroxy-phenyl)propionate hydroxylase
MQPPFLGQGLCQGIRDVANLAWKLRAVLRSEVIGNTAEWLLQTYAIERSVHVRQLIERIKGVGAVICERDPVAARKRDARMLAEHGGVVQSTPRQQLLPRLESGLLGGEPCSARGTLFPQPRLALSGGDSVLMDLQFGYGWRLVMDASLPLPAASPRLTVVSLSTRGFFETDGVVAGWMRHNGCHAALVRPDHYVYGVAETSHELSRLLVQWQATLREQRS